MRLFDLTPAELAVIVDEVYLADQGDFYGRSSQAFDTLQQLRGHLAGRPALAEEVLQVWLGMIHDDEALGLRQEAEDWYDLVLLSGVRPE